MRKMMLLTAAPVVVFFVGLCLGAGCDSKPDRTKTPTLPPATHPTPMPAPAN